MRRGRRGRALPRPPRTRADLGRPSVPQPQLEPSGHEVGEHPPSMFQRCPSGSRPWKEEASSATRPAPSRGDHVARDVGGVEPVVRQGRRRVLARGRAVHGGDGPGASSPTGASLQPDRARADGMAVGRGQVHEAEVVRMLVVHQRLAVERLPVWNSQACPLGEGRRLERVHHHEGEGAHPRGRAGA